MESESEREREKWKKRKREIDGKKGRQREKYMERVFV